MSSHHSQHPPDARVINTRIRRVNLWESGLSKDVHQRHFIKRNVKAQVARGNHLKMYRNSESLFCVPGINTVLEAILLQNQTNKHAHSKRDQSCGYQKWGWGVRAGNWMKVVERYKLPVIR